jgi:hypothetical protein
VRELLQANISLNEWVMGCSTMHIAVDQYEDNNAALLSTTSRRFDRASTADASTLLEVGIQVVRALPAQSRS